jgi:hypothetical protein
MLTTVVTVTFCHDSLLKNVQTTDYFIALKSQEFHFSHFFPSAKLRKVARQHVCTIAYFCNAFLKAKQPSFATI